ncbi:GNAT family N-acetyltransferase [Aliikangiella coralliicola]|uniref:GNAT family N-acetyltransferase n=1 Tax=Aliikangiella coralliicola TaxID=2592383 RepID=A0A545UIZ7_9GAMM|nr:GNAT family N-acetyltransferase [Aliikangiella coralliicola]TQV89439.1 GNAT family N-acetyltransferase [Aliikangiella coralliicola]
MIRPATDNDFDDIYQIINDASIAYKGIIPADRWHEPYMSKQELETQIQEGVSFICYEIEGLVQGVMGFQNMVDVNLVRHAYVRTVTRNKGIGSILINALIEKSNKPILVGTWKAASWAIRFYEKHGFSLVSEEEKNRLLKKYWNIPERQIETSVVLADGSYT